ncbi:hypothetical protein EDD17DRAFT_1541765 [Pisolithus thermaeus]|nr:hypothetical protein EV401DRAFT_1932987 [Pisolithus croceorrhizus]KAI6166881.1 hypothetical protein EDD17DRAFT_1541765 [Pisolithus thermaeus]
MLAVSSDFAVVLQSLCLLTQRCVTPGYSAGGSFFSTDCFDAACFKLHHRLFESIDPTVDGVTHPWLMDRICHDCPSNIASL